MLCSTNEMCPKLVLTTKKRDWRVLSLYSLFTLFKTLLLFSFFSIQFQFSPSSSLIVNFSFLLSEYCVLFVNISIYPSLAHFISPRPTIPQFPPLPLFWQENHHISLSPPLSPQKRVSEKSVYRLCRICTAHFGGEGGKFMYRRHNTSTDLTPPTHSPRLISCYILLVLVISFFFYWQPVGLHFFHIMTLINFTI